MARLMLWIRCAACGEPFDTGIRMDRRNFDRATFASNYHRCPRCETRGMYHKEEYVLREERAEQNGPGGYSGGSTEPGA
jgi:DNA-directed RNA polymerase subunit RPC12/RpoP